MINCYRYDDRAICHCQEALESESEDKRPYRLRHWKSNSMQYDNGQNQTISEAVYETQKQGMAQVI
jgi:hypothetical protein